MKKLGSNILSQIVYSPEKLRKRLETLLKDQKTKPQVQRNPVMPFNPRNATVTDLPSLAQDPSITDLPLEKIPTANVQAVTDPELGKMLTGDHASSYIDGQEVAVPGAAYPVGDARFDQQMALATVTQIHDLYESVLQRKFDWNEGQKRVLVQVRAGEEPNSDYAPGNPSSYDPIERQDRVQLFYFHDPKMNKTIYAAESKEVTSHEGGHGITDTLRPFYSQAFNLESLAFHEGQSDVDSMILDLQNPDLLKAVINKTGGDLSKHNYLSDVGEEFGQGISDLYRLPSPYIRSGDTDPNVFRMTDWRNLPFAPRQGLGAEPHTFSQVWSGAWYDGLNGIYQHLRQNGGMTPEQALSQAGQVMTTLAVRQFDFSSVGDVHFDDMALCQLKTLKTDYSNSPYYQDFKNILEKAFIKRGILTQSKINAWEQEDNAVPPLPFDSRLQKPTTAEAWLRSNAAALQKFDPNLTQRVLAGMEFDRAYSNGKGEIFVNFIRTKPVRFTENDLDSPDLDKYKDALVGQGFNMFGGLNLGFDSSGKLFAYNHDRISPDEIKDTKDYILELVKEGIIQVEDPNSPQGPYQATKNVRVLGAITNHSKAPLIRRTKVCAGFKSYGIT